MIFQKIRYSKYFFGILFKNWFESLPSYAQHGEDLLIEKLLLKVNSFIDIGANNGVLFSNTFKFAKNGSIGLCLEPSKTCFRKLRLNHLFHHKVKCLNSAVSYKKGTLFIEEDGYESVLSNVSENPTPKSYLTSTTTLEDLILRFPDFKSCDLVSIDVEGHEEAVLDGAGNSLMLVKIIILEVDKTNMDKILQKPALSNHDPAFSNGINLILLNKNFEFPKEKQLPSGFLHVK